MDYIIIGLVAGYCIAVIIKKINQIKQGKYCSCNCCECCKKCESKKI